MCAVLSVVKPEMLLMVEKLLLRHKSRGYTLVPRDVVGDEGTSGMLLPVVLHKNSATSDEMGSAVPMSPASVKNGSFNRQQKYRPTVLESYVR